MNQEISKINKEFVLDFASVMLRYYMKLGKALENGNLFCQDCEEIKVCTECKSCTKSENCINCKNCHNCKNIQNFCDMENFDGEFLINFILENNYKDATENLDTLNLISFTKKRQKINVSTWWSKMEEYHALKLNPELFWSYFRINLDRYELTPLIYLNLIDIKATLNYDPILLRDLAGKYPDVLKFYPENLKLKIYEESKKKDQNVDP